MGHIEYISDDISFHIYLKEKTNLIHQYTYRIIKDLKLSEFGKCHLLII
jgi:hypothetical protein